MKLFPETHQAQEFFQAQEFTEHCLKVPKAVFVPFASHNPNGADITHDPILDKLRCLVKENRWHEVGTRCIEILMHTSKDHYVFVTLSQAVAFGSFQNLCRGLELQNQAFCSFWDSKKLEKIIPYLDDVLCKQCYKYSLTDKTKVSQAIAASVKNECMEGLRPVAYLSESVEMCSRVNNLIHQRDSSLPLLRKLMKTLKWTEELCKVSKVYTQSKLECVSKEVPKSELQLKSRQEAYRLLAQVRDYLALNEPQGITTALLEILYSWENRRLNDILVHLQNLHPQALEVMCRLLGTR